MAGRDVLAMDSGRVAPHARDRRVDGLSGPRQGAEPVAQDRQPTGRSLRARRCQPRRGPRPRGGDAQAGADRRPRCSHGPLSAPALGRHAAAGLHRDGARGQSGAADPGRADHRARRHGRGRGAGSEPSCAARSRPRSCSSATTSRWWPRCATASACSMPGRWSRKARPQQSFTRRAIPTRWLSCAACRGAASARTSGGSTPFRASCRCPARRSAAAPSPRAARWPTISAAAPRRPSPTWAGNGRAVTTPTARRACRGPRRPTRRCRPGIDRTAAPVLDVQALAKTFDGGVQALKDVELALWPGETLGLVGEFGQRQDRPSPRCSWA